MSIQSRDVTDETRRTYLSFKNDAIQEDFPPPVPATAVAACVIALGSEDADATNCCSLAVAITRGDVDVMTSEWEADSPLENWSEYTPSLCTRTNTGQPAAKIVVRVERKCRSAQGAFRRVRAARPNLNLVQSIHGFQYIQF